MNLSLGIVGMPNVGKSTLFNSLTKNSIPAENYPFCTIDPNHGVVAVNDARLEKIAEIEKPEKITPAVVEFVDIAGLVKGASKGEGLGNQFLANIREVSAIVHVVRSFNDSKISHVENSVDPKRDIELINTELILKDLETIQGRKIALKSKARTNKKFEPLVIFLENLERHLSSGKLAFDYQSENNDETSSLRTELFLLTDKPVLFIVNSSEEDFVKDRNFIQEAVGAHKVIALNIKAEAELSALEEAEKKEFMEELGIRSTGLDLLTKEAYKLLGLVSFFTSGPKESRAWTIKTGSIAPKAAGVIHSDIENNFIAADVVNWKDFVDLEGWNNSRDNGKVALQGKDYIVKDGDLILFKHNS